MRHLRFIPSVTVLLLLGVSSAVAQDRLYYDGFELGAFGRFGERIGPANGFEFPLIAGGRIAVGPASVVDLQTGATRSLPPGASVVGLDVARPRLFLAFPAATPAGTFDVSLFDVVSGVLKPLASAACGEPLIGAPVVNLAYAYSAEVVFMARCTAAQTAQDVVAIDLRHEPPAVRVVPVPASQRGAMTASPDARWLFYSASADFSGPGATDAYDAATGARLGTAATGGELTWDEGGERAIVAARSGLETVVVSLFTPSLQPLGAAAFSSRVCSVRIQISAHTERIYVTTNGGSNTTAEPARLLAFAGAPLALAGAATLPLPGPPSCDGAVLRTAPGPPRHLQATVTGRAVALAWTNVGGAAGFALEVGVAPGRTDLTIPLGPRAGATFSNVPPGTYFLRLRGGNAFGGGRPSQEIRVVVP